VESTLRSFASRRPDNLIAETGIKAELSHRGVSSRRGQNRADLNHMWIDPIIVAAPWAASLWLAGRMVRRLRG
jgi:hypothetical protein